MMTKLLITTLFGFLSCVAFASDDAVNSSLSATMDGGLLMADNPRKGRRDDRQGDREGYQDCRQEEGRVGDRVGDDKRECKQEERGEGDEDEGAEADEPAEA